MNVSAEGSVSLPREARDGLMRHGSRSCMSGIQSSCGFQCIKFKELVEVAHRCASQMVVSIR